MILENEQEKYAFDFICKIASETLSNNGCNDLTKEQIEVFSGLKVETSDNNKIIEVPITFDFDILNWLQKQNKDIEWHN